MSISKTMFTFVIILYIVLQSSLINKYSTIYNTYKYVSSIPKTQLIEREKMQLLILYLNCAIFSQKVLFCWLFYSGIASQIIYCLSNKWSFLVIKTFTANQQIKKEPIIFTFKVQPVHCCSFTPSPPSFFLIDINGFQDHATNISFFLLL